MNLVLLGIGLLLLVKGADVLVASASRLARIFHVPAFIIGLFIIAIGTSAPEAAVGVFSGIQGNNLITLGDVVGSSIVNIALIIGITALIAPIKVECSIPRKEMLIMMGVQVIFFGMILTGNRLSAAEALLLLVGMAAFTWYVYAKSKQDAKKYDMSEEQDALNEEQEREAYEQDLGEEELPKEKIGKLVLLLLLGLVGMIAGANMAVTGAVAIAHSLGLSEALIGLTIVAFGTSLPELVTSLVAVFKKEEDIAVGNIVGSNIFNILFVMGLSGILHPITTGGEIYFDLFVMIGMSLLLFLPSFFLGRISRRTGLLYVAAYVLFLVIKIGGL